MHTNQVDYDSDGDLDIYVLRGAWFGSNGNIPNSLIENKGNGKFEDVTFQSKLYIESPGQTAVWADFDLDGDMDMFLGRESSKSNPGNSSLFQNNGDKSFSEIIFNSGLDLKDAYVKGCNAADINNDMYPDLIVSTWSGNNKLYLNTSKEKGKISFEDITASAGLVKANSGFACWFWDYNNDGWEDIFIAQYVDSESNGSMSSVFAKSYISNSEFGYPTVYKNLGGKKFELVTEEVNLSKTLYAMGSNFGDINNDGFEDFYLGTGHPSFTTVFPNRMFLNENGNRFLEVTYSGGFGHLQKGHGVSFGDFDNDGDQDIFELLGGAYEGDLASNALFLNPGNENSWITIDLKGTQSNRFGVGAKIKLTCELTSGETQVFHKVVGSGSSFGANSLRAEIGLGKTKVIKEILVKWPCRDQSESKLLDVKVNQVIQIDE